MLRNGRLAEEYGYDAAGRRSWDWTPERGRRFLDYDRVGRLKWAGEVEYHYGQDDTLTARYVGKKQALHLDYARNLGLRSLCNKHGRPVNYRTNPAGQPLAKYADNEVFETFRWLDLVRLAEYRCLERGYGLVFHYQGGNRLPYAATFSDGEGSRPVFFGYDQVGSLKAVGDERVELIKTIDYDSFGTVLSEDWGWLFIPVGFAGGLRDRDTDFVRFGHRDYDLDIGRFVAQDPVGDTGGDHDPYEYCVDDPVNAVDPKGLKKEKADGQDAQPEGAEDTSGQEEPNRKWTNSTEGESQHRVIYTEKAGKPVPGEMADIAQCIADSAGQDITISGAWEFGHSKGSAQETGNTIDINKVRTPDLTRGKAEEAYERCMPKSRSYAEEKWNLFHIQSRAGKGGAIGFSPGVKPGK